ncbi:hypothetical protein HUJ05_002468 [Dendroctonus ponderosae]|nr:hypothetical protein HUJ05_002468 [Dendroctonus ponderosae]
MTNKFLIQPSIKSQNLPPPLFASYRDMKMAYRRYAAVIFYYRNDFCSPGYLPCYATEKECGERFVDSINLEDGEADRGAHPWQVYMRNLTSNFSGSGVLLDAFHVLTIAHKVEDITVYLGVWDPTNLSDTQYSQVKEVIKNISFDNDTLMNDIAILRLEHPIALGVQDNINTICLPEPETTFAGTSCMVSGWGQSAFQTFDAPTSPQKQVRVTITDPESCQRSFARPTLLGNLVDYYLDQEGEICAGGEANKDACSRQLATGHLPLVDDKLGTENLWVMVVTFWFFWYSR